LPYLHSYLDRFLQNKYIFIVFRFVQPLRPPGRSGLAGHYFHAAFER
jgi:hypothetical protein